jgi:hypothetical protein
MSTLKIKFYERLEEVRLVIEDFQVLISTGPLSILINVLIFFFLR